MYNTTISVLFVVLIVTSYIDQWFHCTAFGLKIDICIDVVFKFQFAIVLLLFNIIFKIKFHPIWWVDSDTIWIIHNFKYNKLYKLWKKFRTGFGTKYHKTPSLSCTISDIQYSHICVVFLSSYSYLGLWFDCLVGRDTFEK